MSHPLALSQIIVAVLLVTLILLQQRGQALGSAFGGSSEFYAARRGLQQKMFVFTIILGAVFIALAVVNLLI